MKDLSENTEVGVIMSKKEKTERKIQMFEILKEAGLELVRDLSDEFYNFVTDVEKPYTLEDTVKYFIESKPRYIESVRGALIREKTGIGYRLTHMFLDSDGHFVVRDDGSPYGFRIDVYELDAELEDHFGDSDMLVLE